MKGRKILIRADGGEGIGMGKLITALAIGHRLKKEGANVLFVTVRHHMWSPSVFKGMPTKILPKCFFQESMVLTDREIKEFKPDIVILNITDPDIYMGHTAISGFPEWILGLRKQEIKVVGIEGGVTQGYRPDVHIVWNIVSLGRKLHRFPDTSYYIGPSYAVVREPFQKAREQRKAIKKSCGTIFVSLGGGTEGVERVLFPRIMAALSLTGFSGNVFFVVGAAYRDPQNLFPLMARWPNAKVLYNIPATELAKLMLKSDLAITASGITLYELSCIGVPSITVAIVPHQVFNAKAFEKAKATKNAGMNPSVETIQKVVAPLLKNTKERKRMSETARKVVDGKGMERILLIIKGLV